MKKFVTIVLSFAVLCTAVPVFGAEAPVALEAIYGAANNLLAENFSSKNADGSATFESKSFTKNDTGKTIPGWGMIAESSKIEGIDVSGLGEKAYKIPLSESQLQKDIGIRISATELGTKRAYLDVWNIPVANIKGAEKYRFEYNVYIDIGTPAEKSGVLSDITFYTSDVEGATKSFGTIGFSRDGTVSYCTNATKNLYQGVKDANGKTITYQNKAWQHVILDIDIKNSTMDCTLNGNKILTEQALPGTLVWNGETGTYRVRMAFTPKAGDSGTYVVFDDVLFAKYTDAEVLPALAALVRKNGTKTADAADFSCTTSEIQLKNVENISKNSVTVSDGTKTVAVKIAEKDGACALQFGETLQPDKLYTVTFDRFISSDGKTFLSAPAALRFYAHNVAADNFGLIKDGKMLTTLSGADESTAATATVSCAKESSAVLVVTQYNAAGETEKIWQSEQVTLKPGGEQTLTAPLDGLQITAGCTLKLSVWESIENPRPLCNAVTIR